MKRKLIVDKNFGPDALLALIFAAILLIFAFGAKEIYRLNFSPCTPCGIVDKGVIVPGYTLPRIHGGNWCFECSTLENPDYIPFREKINRLLEGCPAETTRKRLENAQRLDDEMEKKGFPRRFNTRSSK